MRNGNQTYMHGLNLHMVLEEIIRSGEISGEDLSKKLPFGRATIHDLTTELQEKGFIKEIGVQSRSVGRSPLMMSLDRDAGRIISVDVGTEITSAILTDLLGKVLKFRQILTPSDPSLLSVQITELIESLSFLAPECRFGLAGIAIGVHGVVAGGRIQEAFVYDIAGSGLIPELERCFEAPVYAAGVSNLAALGESSFSRHHTTLASISLYPEVGTGLSSDNQLISGRSGYVGNLGHMTAVCGGRPCYCGSQGCLEQYLSEKALLKDFTAKSGLARAAFAQFLEALRRRSSKAEQVLEEFVCYMALAVNHVLLAYSPELIIINSSFTEKLPGLLDRIRDRLPRRSGLVFRLETSELKERAPLLGGVSLVAKKLMGIEHFYVKKEEETPV